MDSQDFLAGLRNGKMTRRQMTQALASVGLGLVAMPMIPRDARAAPNMVLMEWSGYENPRFHPEWAAKYGGEPAVTHFAESEQAFQKIRAGFKVDVSHPCTAYIGRWRDGGLIHPIDTSRVPRWGDIIPELFNAKGIMHEGEPWFMPWDFYYSQVAYNPAIISVENPTFAILSDPKFKGKIAMNAQLDVAVAVGGVIGGFTEVFNPTDAEIEKLGDIWRQIIDNSRFIWTAVAEVEQAFASGEIGAAYMWTVGVRRLKQDQNIFLETIPPILPWICGLVLHNDAPGDKQQAYDYLDAMLDPVGGKALFEEFGYGHSNRNTYELIDPNILADYGLSDPVKVLKGGVFYDPIPQKKKERLIALWEEVQAGM